MVVIAYLGWAAYGATTILFPDHPPSSSTAISGIALVALGASWTLFAIQKYPITFYLYTIFPCYFWREALVASSGPLIHSYCSGMLRGSVKILLYTVFVIAALQSMVVRTSNPHDTVGNLRFTFTNRLDIPTGASGVSGSSSSGSFGQPGVGRAGSLKNISVHAQCGLFFV